MRSDHFGVKSPLNFDPIDQVKIINCDNKTSEILNIGYGQVIKSFMRFGPVKWNVIAVLERNLMKLMPNHQKLIDPSRQMCGTESQLAGTPEGFSFTPWGAKPTS